jgi:uncharacterized protein YfdQ (DUF2303 family)
MFDKEAIEALAESASINEATIAVNAAMNGEGAAALPEHFRIHDLEGYMPNRRRARGTMSTSVLEDFATYVTINREEGAAVFVDADAMTANAVLNLGKPSSPGHADNKAVLKAKMTAAYEALKAHANGRPIGQTAVAEFFEDWTGYFMFFKETETIAPSKAIAAVRKITIESLRKLESEEKSLSASRSTFENVQATSAEPIPTTIYFKCQPYFGLEDRNFVLRLSVITSGEKPAISLRIVKQEEHDEAMAKEFAQQVETCLSEEVPVLLGSYSTR